jgi:peptidoglycan/LPS O-acetylase OafA/YrhL
MNPSDSSISKMPSRIPELDGVRGIAVLFVILLHASWAAALGPGVVSRIASYGFAGVDLFFVLSGFLITGILLNAKGDRDYFRNFYLKRALRIWPLYYALLLVAFGLVPTVIRHAHLLMGELPILESKNIFVYIFMLQNLWYPGSAAPSLLGVTWSLAIEEQFYFVWPWLVLLCSRKKLTIIVVAVLFFSPLLRVWAKGHGIADPSIYSMTWFRLDGLSIGALVALWCKSEFFSVVRMKWIALSAMIVGVPASLWLFEDHSKVFVPLFYSVISIASAGLMMFAIWCCMTNSFFGLALRSTSLRYIGRISYCLYLVHQPVYYFLASRLVKDHTLGSGAAFSVMAFGFVVTLGIASLSWYFFESPILKLKGKLEYHPCQTLAKI